MYFCSLALLAQLSMWRMLCISKASFAYEQFNIAIHFVWTLFWGDGLQFPFTSNSNSNPPAPLKQVVVCLAQRASGGGESLEVACEKVFWDSMPSGWERVWGMTQKSLRGESLNFAGPPHLTIGNRWLAQNSGSHGGKVSIENISVPIFPFCQKDNDLKFENFLNPAEGNLKFGPIPFYPEIGWVLRPAVSLT